MTHSVYNTTKINLTSIHDNDNLDDIMFAGLAF